MKYIQVTKPEGDTLEFEVLSNNWSFDLVRSPAYKMYILLVTTHKHHFANNAS